MPRASFKLPKCHLSTNHKARTPLAVPAHSHAILPQAQPQLPLALLRVVPAFYIISYHAEKRLALPCGLSSPKYAAGGQAVPTGLPAWAVHMASSTSPRSLFAALLTAAMPAAWLLLHISSTSWRPEEHAVFERRLHQH